MIGFITTVNLEGTNANLLIALDALLREGSVTGAARRLKLTQPAASNALAKLRQLFDDPLLVRAGHSMVPTATARRLARPIATGVAAFREALAMIRSFDPARSTESFRIASSDYAQSVLLPPLINRLSTAAPSTRLVVHPWGRADAPSGLETGEIDLALGFYADVPAGYFAEKLFDEHLVGIARSDHRGLKKKVSLREYLRLRHIVVSQRPGTPGIIDTVLRERGHERDVGLHVPHFLLVPLLVASTDMVAAVNSRTATQLAKPLGLRVFELPIAVPPASFGQLWHARTTGDPAHEWLRKTISTLAVDPPQRQQRPSARPQ